MRLRRRGDRCLPEHLLEHVLKAGELVIHEVVVEQRTNKPESVSHRSGRSHVQNDSWFHHPVSV
jgi:hypothetical protein